MEFKTLEEVRDSIFEIKLKRVTVTRDTHGGFCILCYTSDGYFVIGSNGLSCCFSDVQEAADALMSIDIRSFHVLQ